MVIERAGTFSYVAAVPALAGSPSEIELRGKNSFRGACLVGPSPRIILRRNEIVIVADTRDDATAWKFTCWPGDAVFIAVRAGDRIHFGRGGTTDLGVSVMRGEELVVAFGCAHLVPIGDMSVQVDPGHAVIGFRSDGNEVKLGERERGQVADFDLYVERLPEGGFPGKTECVAISRRALGLDVAAMRSAILLASSGQKIIGWDFFGEGH